MNPHGSIAQLGTFRLAESENVLASYEHRASFRLVQGPEHVEQGALADPGRAHDRNHFPFLNREVRFLQNREIALPGAKTFHELSGLEKNFTHSVAPR